MTCISVNDLSFFFFFFFNVAFNFLLLLSSFNLPGYKRANISRSQERRWEHQVQVIECHLTQLNRF